MENNNALLRQNMKNTVKKKTYKVFLSRLLLVGFVLCVQLVWFYITVSEIARGIKWLNYGLKGLSFILVLYLISRSDNPAYKIVWLLLLLVSPIFGSITYLIFKNKKMSRKIRKKIECEKSKTEPLFRQKEEILKSIEDKTVRNQMYYISKVGRYPAYKNSTAQYYSSGESAFEAVKREISKAKHYIFLEFFIIAEGEMWDDILEILQEKQKQGVDIRVIYDDVGSVAKLPYKYYKKIENMGIKCVAFNPFKPILSVAMNNRDHRKIIIIDGHTAFTGGINLADEYINKIHPYGYWKDSAIMIKGEAVWNFSKMFLEMWNVIREDKLKYEQYTTHRYYPEAFEGDGYIQPYGSSALEYENVGENVYLNIISGAVDYVYIFTPYLIVDNEMIVALSNAAKRGVDVRIVTPGIPDKKSVFILTKSYYMQLLQAGVRIYQFTPGFIHAKSFVCDDKIAIVGTVNMDYRSLYLHFECGVFLYQNEAVMQVKEDVLETFKISKEMIPQCVKQSIPISLYQAVLRVLAPLM